METERSRSLKSKSTIDVEFVSRRLNVDGKVIKARISDTTASQESNCSSRKGDERPFNRSQLDYEHGYLCFHQFHPLEANDVVKALKKRLQHKNP
ncbi:Ras-related protein RABA1c [Camellia lanceoleosa]|uniref:Ras-related protein RABA1c n=1 Tax=Camellia lanceoleosa TaxID=1840588 RepID=A0ACC0F1T1_9ERIC|nr:Ras-related protein RABA1c [Camellia lanceoleosa]